ncbi:MAG: response regulator, partial [Planctomycetota bacterium]
MSSLLEPTSTGQTGTPVLTTGFGERSETTRSHWADEYERLLATARIAVIDDEELNIEIVQGHLRHEGYQNFHRATDGTQALDLIRTVQPDVVLMDVLMPGVN